MPGALKAEEIASQLGLTELRNRTWMIFKTSAINGNLSLCSCTFCPRASTRALTLLGEGLFEGLDWLTNAISTRA
jgi:hypothetical protein